MPGPEIDCGWSREGARRRVKPGEIVSGKWLGGKLRPWIVLWVDDHAETVCMAAMTSKEDFSTLRIPEFPSGFIGNTVTVQPRAFVARRQPVKTKRIGSNTRKMIRAHFLKLLDLIDEQEDQDHD